jgi:hypothetical protein
MKKSVLAFCLLALGCSFVRADESPLIKQLQMLNQVPEEQLNEKVDPAFSILRSLYDQDGPDFLNLRTLLGKADIRAHLNPSARCVLADVISQRWDTFALSGSLYLTGLQSKNPDLRDRARKKLIGFIQPAHIPAVIDLLRIPGPNVLAYEVLQEATGQHIDPSVKSWQKWWQKTKGKVDVVGHVLNDTRNRLKESHVHAFDQERFWYAPAGVDDVQIPFGRRPEREQQKISDWSNWVRNDVKMYAEDWATPKTILDRIVHQPDPRVSKYLETLANDPGFGDYASIVLAWRYSVNSLPIITSAWKTLPTPGRALARGSLGDKTALADLLEIIERHQSQPLTYKIMDDDARSILTNLRTVGIVSAEQALKLLCHQNFDFESANTAKEKKKVYKTAKTWLTKNAARLQLDRRRGYYTVATSS